jgi:ribosomal protein S18 acetylase RimI-like enzyme
MIANMLGIPSASGVLRPLEVRHDLGRVADLVEYCFADTLDVDGRRYIQQMRAVEQNPSTLSWVNTLSERVSLPISGFVWEEDGKIVGNLTLIPYHVRGVRYYLIANVAVHPDYRRRGIGFRLTNRALEQSRQQNIPATWLHVREENAGAIQLYRSLGFKERASRTTWMSDRQVGDTHVEKGGNPVNQDTRVRVGSRHSEDWVAQSPGYINSIEELKWHLPFKPAALQPGFKGFLYRSFNDTNIHQWSAWQAEKLIGVLAWHSSHAYADSLWLATYPEAEDTAAAALLNYARQHISHLRPLSLDFPAGRAVQAIQDAGFYKHQTLIWMCIETAPRIGL